MQKNVKKPPFKPTESLKTVVVIDDSPIFQPGPMPTQLTSTQLASTVNLLTQASNELAYSIGYLNTVPMPTIVQHLHLLIIASNILVDMLTALHWG